MAALFHMIGCTIEHELGFDQHTKNINYGVTSMMRHLQEDLGDYIEAVCEELDEAKTGHPQPSQLVQIQRSKIKELEAQISDLQTFNHDATVENEVKRAVG
jgi:hypothetical protein